MAEDLQNPTRRGEPEATADEETGWWHDEYGILGPYKPGIGPRSDPRDAFPTGPAVGHRFPDLVAPDQTGELVDVHAARAGKPAVVVFARATEW